MQGFVLEIGITNMYPVLHSMDKARKFGWHGFVDSGESLLEVFEDLAKIKMIPPLPKFQS